MEYLHWNGSFFSSGRFFFFVKAYARRRLLCRLLWPPRGLKLNGKRGTGKKRRETGVVLVVRRIRAEFFRVRRRRLYFSSKICFRKGGFSASHPCLIQSTVRAFQGLLKSWVCSWSVYYPFSSKQQGWQWRQRDKLSTGNRFHSFLRAFPSSTDVRVLLLNHSSLSARPSVYEVLSSIPGNFTSSFQLLSFLCSFD